ncbi:MAG: SatD family protein [Aeromicrobium sp.]
MKQMTGITLIGDVVGSRTHPDRSAMQTALVAVLDRVNAEIEAVQPLVPTIGDEFQAVYRDVASAVNATLRIRLSLPEGLDCRFGLGAGAYADVGTSPYGVMQDGPAWWSARDAIVIAKNREHRKNGTLRTWFCIAEPMSTGGQDASMPAPEVINALVLCRDHLVTGMNARQRRLLLGMLEGKTQAVLATAEGVSPSAVSQALHSSGAYAVLASHDTLGGAV